MTYNSMVYVVRRTGEKMVCDWEWNVQWLWRWEGKTVQL